MARPGGGTRTVTRLARHGGGAGTAAQLANHLVLGQVRRGRFLPSLPSGRIQSCEAHSPVDRAAVQRD
jgi:hypothetical protein